MAPRPSNVKKTVFEKRDRPEESYAGNSLHLAYVLAYISCHREVKMVCSGDVWCTGKIELNDVQEPRLIFLGSPGVFAKLQAFLAPTNQDSLFFLPAKDIQKRHRILCEEHHVPLASLSKFQANYQDNKPIDSKLVIMLEPDELYRLISVVFALAPNPYKGLSSFQCDEAGWFFGRKEQVDKLTTLYARLQPSAHEHQTTLCRVMTIFGPSGVGKSSLARAGFVAYFHRSSAENFEKPKIFDMKPGQQPLHNLAGTLLEAPFEQVDSDSAVRRLVEEMRQDNERLARFFAERSQRPTLLLLDQFEEIFLSPSEKETPEQGIEHDRNAFINNLVIAASHPRNRVCIVIVLRSDFLDATQAYPDLNEAITAQLVAIPAMHLTQLRDVIEEPARRAGHTLSRQLVDRLLADAQKHPGALPLLEFALTRIWDGIKQGVPPQETFEQMKGVGGALAERAEYAYHHKLHSEAERRIARRAFMHMVGREASEGYVGRRINLTDIETDNAPPEIVHQVLMKFSEDDARLITLKEEDGKKMAQMMHDALFQHWDFLRKLAERDSDRQFRERLTQAVSEWETDDYSKDRVWTGRKFVELQDYYHDHKEDMNPRQQDFYRASRRRHRWFTTVKWGGLLVLCLLTIVSAVGWIRATQRAWQLERQRNEIIKNVSLSARQLMDSHDQLGALTSIIKATNSMRENRTTPSELSALVKDTFRGIAVNLVEKNRLEQHEGPIFAFSFNRQGNLLASGGSDGTIQIWLTGDGRLQTTLDSNTDEATSSLAFAADTDTLLSGHGDGSLRVWDIRKQAPPRIIEAHNGTVHSIAVGVYSHVVATAGQDGMIHLWNGNFDTQEHTFSGHRGSVYQVVFNPDETRLASVGQDGSIRIWDVKLGILLKTIRTEEKFLYSVVFSPDDEFLASGGQDGMVKVWRLTDGELIQEMQGHTDVVYHVTFQPDGLLLASASHDRTVRIWNVEEGTSRVLHGHTDAVYQVEFHPGNPIIASAGKDQTIKLWEPSIDISDESSIEELLQVSCQRIAGYLSTNQKVDQDTRTICQQVQIQTKGNRL